MTQWSVNVELDYLEVKNNALLLLEHSYLILKYCCLMRYECRWLPESSIEVWGHQGSNYKIVHIGDNKVNVLCPS